MAELKEPMTEENLEESARDEASEDPSVERAAVETPLHRGARGTAVKILTRIEQSDAYLDKLLDYELRTADLNEPDRRLLTELTTGVLRWQAKLDWVLTGFYHGEFTKCIPLVKNAMRVALYQILFLTRVPFAAAVHEAVEYVKRLKGERSANLVNAVLRSIIRKINAITYPDPGGDPVHYLSVTLSHPQWMVRRWIARLGVEETERMLQANNERPPVSIRVNPMRTTPEELVARLQAQGLKIGRSEVLTDFLRGTSLSMIASIPEFRDGYFSIQDEGAALAARLTAAGPGMRVIDLCAAPGGKSTAMAEMMRGEGTIVAVDKYEAKLRMLGEASRRLGFDTIIEPTQGDARSLAIEPADVVLVDAPCSGLGVLSKKPDIKWKRRPEEIEQLAALQHEILDNAAELVRPGGHLVYSTCTIEPAENEQVIHAFLERHPDFELVPATEVLEERFTTPDGFLQTYPQRHGVDGTFGARMRRKA
jgi:16S rRNA (cytosine967-C5)-methyltransferase